MKKLLVLLLLPIGWGIWKYQSTHHPDLPGYQVDAGEIQREHEKIYGNPLDSAEIDKGFAGARAYVHRAQYRDAIMFFRSANKIAALPIFYNNLGTLYVATHDFPKAITAFHQALNRDPTYQPAIDNLNELKKRPEGQLAVLEAEPNNNPDLANDFAFDLPVAATIEAGLGDTDVYALTTPPAPRDPVRGEDSKTTTPTSLLGFAFSIPTASRPATGISAPNQAPRLPRSSPPNRILNYSSRSRGAITQVARITSALMP